MRFNNSFRPLIVIFLSVNCFLIVFSKLLSQKGIDTSVVIGGNFILFITSVLSLIFYNKKTEPNRPQALVQNVYGGFILKFFVLAASILLYCFLANPVNKPAIFICMVLYLSYNFLATSMALKKQKKHQKN